MTWRRKETEAHTDLNLFAAIVALCEGGLIYTTHGHRTAARIIKICQTEQAYQLREYDRARAALDLPAQATGQ